MPLVSFYTLWKLQKTFGLPMFSGGIEKPVAWNGLTKWDLLKLSKFVLLLMYPLKGHT